MRRSAFAAALTLVACSTPPAAPAWRGSLRDPAAVAAGDTAGRGPSIDAVVLDVRDDVSDEVVAAAAARVRSARMQLGYWFEIGRDPALADAHPDWVATLQGHGEWREEHAAAASPAAGEVVIAWPWVPVAYAEAFAAHRERVRRRLTALPAADFVFLNDLQGPPAACGCGNVLCRWATDYTLHGAAPQRAATPLGPDAAARFAADVRGTAKAAEVIPVWVTECEEQDTVADGACHGVGCYHGACWREFDRQWVPLRAACPTVALLLPYRAFRRDLPRFGAEAGWVRFAIEHLDARERRAGRPPPAASLIAVVQGWDDADVPAQLAAAAAAGATRVLVAEAPIPQQFEPRLRRADATRR